MHNFSAKKKLLKSFCGVLKTLNLKLLIKFTPRSSWVTLKNCQFKPIFECSVGIFECTVGIWLQDMSGIQMVNMCLIAKWSVN